MINSSQIDGDELQEEVSPLLEFSYVDSDGEETTLDMLAHDDLVQQITSAYERYDSARNNHKKTWKECERIVKGVVSEIDKDRFYALVPYGKQTVQTLVSHFWGRSLQSPKIFFNVDGLDEASKAMAPLQKQNLLLHMDKDRVRQKMDKGIYLHALMKGVIIAHVGTSVKTEKLRGPQGLVNNWAGQGFSPVAERTGDYVDITKTVFDGATLTIIDPYDFVFDTECADDWDGCFKAVKKWMVYEDIAADPNFSNYEELKELCKQGLTGKNNRLMPTGRKRKKDKQTTGIDDKGRIEVIEVHGNIRLKDGSYLRNWTVVIAGRKKVIRFEENPLHINPFIKWEYEPSEDGWSVPPIAYILGLVDAGSILLSTGVEAAKLNINKPILAPEGAIQQKKHFMTEGLVINYKPNPGNPKAVPTPMQFDYQAPFPFLQLFESQSESVTAATRQMSGNVTTNDKVQTATEFQGLQVVGNLIIDRLVDLFNLDFKIPTIEKIALINAIANPEEKTVPIDDQDKGTRQFETVRPEVYFGNYEYKIEDNKSELERKQNLQEKLQFLTMMSQDPVVGPRIKKTDLFKEYLLDYGYGNPGKYFMDDNEFINWSAAQNAIIQEIEIMTQQRLQARMMNEGMIPDANTLAAISQGLAPDSGVPGQPGMEAVQ